LQRLGYATTGIDISAEMIGFAQQHDPQGNYRLIEDGSFQTLPEGGFDLVQSAFAFDNISGHERRLGIFQGLRNLLDVNGILVNIVSTPEIYTNEWVTFSTRDFPGNKDAKSGDVVEIITTDYSDARPVEDVLWTHEDYLQLFSEAGLEVVCVERPLAAGDEGIDWKSETKIAPLRANGEAGRDCLRFAHC
jgi:trans-aconitate methyltransferase